MRRKTFHLSSGLVVLICLLFIRSAAAQVIVGAIEGVAQDAGGGVLPGVTVQASSPALIGDARETLTDANGHYRILRLPVGRYSLSFTLAGFSPFTREDVVVNSGFTATISPVLQIGSVEETVTVTGESPVVDVRGSTIQALVSAEVMNTIPNSRTVFDMTKTLLGASTTRPDVGGSSLVLYTQMQIHGSQSNDRSYYKDGIRLAAYFGGGDAPRTYGSVGAMSEVNYQYSALPASLPSGGMNIVMVFKEGGDAYSGSVFSAFGNDSMQSTNVDQELMDRGVEVGAGIKKIYDVDTSFGGPLKRGKAWFFGSLRFSSVTNLLTNSFFRDGSQSIDFQRRNDYFVKGTFQPNPTNKFSVSISHDGWFRPFRRRDAQFVEQEALLSDADGQSISPYNRVIASRWTATPGTDWIVEAGWGHTRVGAGWEYQPGVQPTDLARLDLVTNTLSGAAATIQGDATLREDFFLSLSCHFSGSSRG